MKTEETTNNLSTEDLNKSEVSGKPAKDKKSGQKNQFFQTTIKRIIQEFGQEFQGIFF